MMRAASTPSRKVMMKACSKGISLAINEHDAKLVATELQLLLKLKNTARLTARQSSKIHWRRRPARHTKSKIVLVFAHAASGRAEVKQEPLQSLLSSGKLSSIQERMRTDEKCRLVVCASE